MLYICFPLNLNIIDMVQLEIELPGEKLGWLGFVEENIAVEESLRLHFYGFLSEERNLTNLVMIELPEGLKLRRNSRIRRNEYESRRLMGSLPELPFWKKIHEGEDYVEVDFEAEIDRITPDYIVVTLPDSYKKEEQKEYNSMSVDGTFTFQVEKYDRDMLKELKKVLHKDEVLRLRFEGTLSLMSNLCQVLIYIPNGLRIAEGGEGLTNYNGDEYLLSTIIKHLPDFEKQVNADGHLVVDFEASVLSIQGCMVKVNLPKSYKRGNIELPMNKSVNSSIFHFRTEHTYLLKMVSMILQEKPIVHFYGPLSVDVPSKVEISLPVKLEASTFGGGRVSLSTQDITLAVVDNIPGWREQAEKFGRPGYLFVNFDAIILSAKDGEIVVELPERYI